MGTAKLGTQPGEDRFGSAYFYTYASYSVNGLTGTFQDPKARFYDYYYYTIKLTDGRQVTLTASTL